MIRIVDAHNYVRRTVETGGTLRMLYSETFNEDIWIYVWDGVNSLASRRAIYPSYKNRPQPSHHSEIYASFDLLKKALSHSPTLQIELPGFEADDVVAYLAMKYRDKHQVHIHSNDADFAQIAGVTLDREKFKIDPMWVRLYKATVGDPSDNIKGIKGFGDKAWDQLTDEQRRLLEHLLQGRDVNLKHISLSKASHNWLNENLEVVRAGYKVVGFLPVDPSLIDRHTRIGIPNPEHGKNLLSEFLL